MQNNSANKGIFHFLGARIWVSMPVYWYENRPGYITARVSPYIFSPRSNLKLYISVTPKMAKKVITNLDWSMASGPDCIAVVVLKNCEPGLSYIPAELFSMCLKESLVVPVFKSVGERFTAKNHCPVSLLSVVSKVFEKLVNNRVVDHLEKCGLFSDFQYGFKSS